MTSIPVISVALSLLGYLALLPALDRLPGLIGWEDERGAVAGLQSSTAARLAFCLTLGAFPFLAAMVFPDFASVLAAVGLLLGLAALAWVDLIEHLVPEVLSVPLLLAGVCFSPLSDLQGSLIGALIGGSFTFVTMFLMAKAKNVDLVAGGDVMLSAIGGAWFGWENVFFFVCLTNLFFLPMVAVNRHFTDEKGFAMGPAYLLAAATMLVAHAFYPNFL